MATYKEIQIYIKDNYGVSVKSCWIADMKDKHNLLTRISANRISVNRRLHPCPDRHKVKLETAFRYFRMI